MKRGEDNKISMIESTHPYLHVLFLEMTSLLLGPCILQRTEMLLLVSYMQTRIYVYYVITVSLALGLVGNSITALL